MAQDKISVLIAGIGGASLGTELLKCLLDAGRYEVFGCDISPLAFGHYEDGFSGTFLVDHNNYVAEVLRICKAEAIQAVIPGGEGPLALLVPARARFESIGVHIAANSPQALAICSDKQRFFERLEKLGLPMPRTLAVTDKSQLVNIPCPCVVKPATGTGGSRFVFLAASRDETNLYVNYLLEHRETALVQEYIPVDEGEFTIGVLSLPDGRLVGSVAMQRYFHSKLSVLTETQVGVISTGYSQGLIDEFDDFRRQAERIGMALDSTGPINIQGRVRDGVLLPFEVNPRFSASTYLRAMAGFNEVDAYLQYVLRGSEPPPVSIRPGHYLRSLAEVYIPRKKVKA